MVLMALIDANLEFIYVDAGQCGRHADGGIWRTPGTSRNRCEEPLRDRRRRGVPPHRELAAAVLPTQHGGVGDGV